MQRTITVEYMITDKALNIYTNKIELSITEKKYQDLLSEYKSMCWCQDATSSAAEQIEKILKNIVKLRGFKKLLSWKVQEFKKEGGNENGKSICNREGACN